MLRIELEREDDGRWIAEVPALPGVLAYGDNEAEARAHATSLALRVIADRIDNGEPLPEEARDLFVCRERLEGDKSKPRAAGAPSHRLDSQAASWLASRSRA